MTVGPAPEVRAGGSSGSLIGGVPVMAPLVLVALVFAVAIGAGVIWAPAFDLVTFVFIAVCVLWGVVQVVVGTVIAWRRPENRVGRLLQTSGVLVAAAFVGYFVAAIRMETSGPNDVMGGVAGWWASSTLFLAIYTAFPLLGLLFPDGRLPGPRWRLPVAGITLAIIACCSLFAVAAGSLGPDLPNNPFGLIAVPAPLWNAASTLGTVLLVVSMALGVGAVVVRWRRGGARERSQLKWLAAAILVSAILFSVSFGGSSDEETSPLAIVGIGSASLIPIAIGVAVLRYRLYDIDRIISRSVGWAIVTGILIAVFGGLVVGLQGLLGGVTQGSTLAVAASTLVAFALFQPVRRRVQQEVDRRFDRARYDGERLAQAFSSRLRDEVDLAAIGHSLLATAHEAVRPADAAVWLRNASRSHVNEVS